jgi:phage-related protein
VATAASAVATGLWTGAQWLLNAALTANPIGIVIAVIALLVVAIIVAYKKSDTFRAIVQAAMRGVVAAFGWLWDKAKAVFGWIKGNWRLIFAILTGPIGLAVRWIVSHFGKILSTVRGLPGKIKSAFGNANSMLVGVGRSIVHGLWNGITGLTGWLVGKVRSFIENTVPGPIRSALGIGSPSKVARKLTQWVGVGLGLGLDDMHGTVKRAATRLATAGVVGPAGVAIAGIPAPRSPGGYGASASGAGGSGGTLRIAGDGALVEALKKVVRDYGAGDVQVAFGSTRGGAR